MSPITIVAGNPARELRKRFDDELIRHKILDAIGDLYLLGPIKAHVIAVKTGHAFNSQIAKQIQAYRTKGE